MHIYKSLTLEGSDCRVIDEIANLKSYIAGDHKLYHWCTQRDVLYMQLLGDAETPAVVTPWPLRKCMILLPNWTEQQIWLALGVPTYDEYLLGFRAALQFVF